MWESECWEVILSGNGGGFNIDTLLNVMCGIRYAKYKKADSIDNKRAARAAKNSAEIAKQMKLGKATVEKLKAIEDNDDKLEAVG